MVVIIACTIVTVMIAGVTVMVIWKKRLEYGKRAVQVLTENKMKKSGNNTEFGNNGKLESDVNDKSDKYMNENRDKLLTQAWEEIEMSEGNGKNMLEKEVIKIEREDWKEEEPSANTCEGKGQESWQKREYMRMKLKKGEKAKQAQIEALKQRIAEMEMETLIKMERMEKELEMQSKEQKRGRQYSLTEIVMLLPNFDPEDR